MTTNKAKNIQLIPVAKAAEDFGVNRQTIINWQNEGLLQCAVIKGNRFVSKDSLDNLKKIYPEVIADANEINAYKTLVEKEREQLKEMLNTVRKERIYRGYAPRYVHNFIENAVSLMKKIDVNWTDNELEDQFIRCWLFGHDIHETCEENGVSYFQYISSAKRYKKNLKQMVDYANLFEKNRKLEDELKETRTQLQRLQADMDEYRERYERVDNEESWKEEYPILTMDLMDLNLTVRTLNILKSYDFKNLGEVITYDRSQLLKLRHFGRKCLTEIQDLLEAYGLELGMDLGVKPEKD